MESGSDFSILSARSFIGEADEHGEPQTEEADKSTPNHREKPSGPSSAQPPLETTDKSRLRSGKRSGRPRIDAGRSGVLSEDRRTQVRRAQKTYRQKREAAFRDTFNRVTDLEEKYSKLSREIGSVYEFATRAQLQHTHPELYARLSRIHGTLLDQDEARESSPQPVAFLKDVTPELVVPPPAALERRDHQIDKSSRQPLLSLPRPLSTENQTYSFQEVRFCRRLQRYCLEHAYRLFTDPRSDPCQIYRVFRLVPCVQDKEKTQPRFEQLLRGGCQSPLEVPGLPFYGIGGAGTHYPDRDELGNAIYPKNMRMPRRVLGILARADLENGSTPMATGDHLLEIWGLGGEWFNCRDVEGYLQQHGLDIQKPSLFPKVRVSKKLSANMHSRHRSYELDVDGFFCRLQHAQVILGRAPGFRKKDVTAAFQKSLRLSSVKV